MKLPNTYPKGFQKILCQTEKGLEEVYVSGKGPNVILLPESPGAHEGVFELGRELAKTGLCIHIMILFGDVNTPYSKIKAAKFVTKACLSKEFTMLSRHRRSPMSERVRAYGRKLYSDRKEPLGIVGMCITGNFALACLAEPWMLAPVLSQPSLPIAIGSNRAKSLNTPESDLHAGATRKELELMGLRFTHDVMCPKLRFDSLNKRFNERFISIEIDSSPKNPYQIPTTAHSVLTVDRITKAGHPTEEALKSVVRFLHKKLGPEQ